MNAEVINAILRLHANQCEALAQELAEGGFLPHTQSCKNVVARLEQLARELRALQEDIEALHAPR